MPLPFHEVALVLQSLRSIPWPASMRRYVPGDGFCVGASMNAHGATFNRPHNLGQELLVKRVNALIKASAHSSFRWTSLQFNCNTVAAPHIDQHNRGLSWIFVGGAYIGGRLVVPSRDFATPANDPCVACYIDGREQHFSERFEGERFSIVAFVHSSFDDTSHAQRKLLESLGFACPPEAPSSHLRGGE